MLAHERQRNAALMRVTEPADLERHGDMFLAWFLPHELVHVADPGMASWRHERTANLVQPYLTAEVLRRLGDATPYSGEVMGWIYDRYVDELAPFVAPARRARIDRFAADANAAAPFDELPLGVLATRPLDYVYFCARLSQVSWQRRADLATVLRETGVVSGR